MLKLSHSDICTNKQGWHHRCTDNCKATYLLWAFCTLCNVSLHFCEQCSAAKHKQQILFPMCYHCNVFLYIFLKCYFRVLSHGHWGLGDVTLSATKHFLWGFKWTCERGSADECLPHNGFLAEHDGVDQYTAHNYVFPLKCECGEWGSPVTMNLYECGGEDGCLTLYLLCSNDMLRSWVN